ncbi:MAG: hypothetical protein P4L43_18475, partial [Syntrophobacteraceae bacterium]|nr:hypothetical protein [Syntrophobacteraceae bacterium]
GTLWDWAQNKGILPDAFRRSLQMQGVGPIANQFADEMGSHPDLQAALTSQVPAFLRQNAGRINQFFMGRVSSLETLEQMGPQGMQTMADDLDFKSVDELKQWVPAMREVWEGSKGVRNDEANPAPSVSALIDYARKAGPQAAQLIAEDHGFSSFDEMVGAHQSAGIGEKAQNATEPESTEGRTGSAPTRVDTDSSPSMEELTARFKPVTPDEFITQRDKSTKQPFLTPYTGEEMQGWQHFLTDDGAGFAITPDRDMVDRARMRCPSQ